MFSGGIERETSGMKWVKGVQDLYDNVTLIYNLF